MICCLKWSVPWSRPIPRIKNEHKLTPKNYICHWTGQTNTISWYHPVKSSLCIISIRKLTGLGSSEKYDAGRPLPYKEFLSNLVLYECPQMYIAVTSKNFSSPAKGTHFHDGYEFMWSNTFPLSLSVDNKALSATRMTFYGLTPDNWTDLLAAMIMLNSWTSWSAAGLWKKSPTPYMAAAMYSFPMKYPVWAEQPLVSPSCS